LFAGILLPSAPAGFNIHSAKTRLSRLIARYDQPVLKDRIPGTAMDKIIMIETLFDPLNLV
jgi:hypothetical protein